jgi:TonB family protein
MIFMRSRLLILLIVSYTIILSNALCAQIKYGSLISIDNQHDTIYTPIVTMEIILDKNTSFTFAAKDTVKPEIVAIIFSANDSLKDIEGTILNSYGSDIHLSQGKKSAFFNVQKKHKVVGIAEVPWAQFESFCNLPATTISTKHRVVDLSEEVFARLFYFHKYLLERHEGEEPPVDFTGYDDAPIVLTQAWPKYPEKALHAGMEGDVIVKMWIDVEGKVKKVVALKASADIFIDSAIEAAHKWTFSPAKIQGESVSVWIQIPFRFRLKENNNPQSK